MNERPALSTRGDTIAGGKLLDVPVIGLATVGVESPGGASGNYLTADSGLYPSVPTGQVNLAQMPSVG